MPTYSREEYKQHQHSEKRFGKSFRVNRNVKIMRSLTCEQMKNAPKTHLTG